MPLPHACGSPLRRFPMDYIMAHAGEAARIRRKTAGLLVGHHLDWVGLRPGQSFVDFGCATGEVTRAAARLAAPGRVVGLDGDPAMVAWARAQAAGQRLGNLAYAEVTIAG